MGADLILTWADLPVQPQGNDDAEDFLSANVALLLERIAAASDKALTSVYEEWQGEDPDDDDDGDWRAETRARLVEAVNELLVEGSRDMTYAFMHGLWVVIAGGTSWGDSFEPMMALDLLLAGEFMGPEGGGNHFTVVVS